VIVMGLAEVGSVLARSGRPHLAVRMMPVRMTLVPHGIICLSMGAECAS